MGLAVAAARPRTSALANIAPAGAALLSAPDGAGVDGADSGAQGTAGGAGVLAASNSAPDCGRMHAGAVAGTAGGDAAPPTAVVPP